MANELIRSASARYHVRHWEIAQLIGISEAQYHRRMRAELPNEEQQRIVGLVKDFAMERDGGGMYA